MSGHVEEMRLKWCVENSDPEAPCFHKLAFITLSMNFQLRKMSWSDKIWCVGCWGFVSVCEVAKKKHMTRKSYKWKQSKYYNARMFWTIKSECRREETVSREKRSVLHDKKKKKRRFELILIQKKHIKSEINFNNTKTNINDGTCEEVICILC